MLFKDKVVIVTGAGSGIGYATAERFLQEGARVVAFDKNIKNCEALEDVAEKYFTEVQIIEGDLAEVKQIKAVFTWLKKKWGHLDILINNAGISKHSVFEKISEDDFEKTMCVNVKGSFFMAQEAVAMIKRGVIINVASVEGLVGCASHADYVASKGAMISLTKALALEFAPDIRINAVAPGPIDTPLIIQTTRDPQARRRRLSEIPMARFGRPEEVAEGILWLASDKASFCTGTILTIDGGFSAK
jgi:meso-butanediol dehydrogenase / (S,S)-butanediol dehydrogenase / diacetyl reductase